MHFSCLRRIVISDGHTLHRCESLSHLSLFVRHINSIELNWIEFLSKTNISCESKTNWNEWFWFAGVQRSICSKQKLTVIVRSTKRKKKNKWKERKKQMLFAVSVCLMYLVNTAIYRRAIVRHADKNTHSCAHSKPYVCTNTREIEIFMVSFYIFFRFFISLWWSFRAGTENTRNM